MALPELIARLELEAQSRIDAIRKDALAQISAIESATSTAARDATTSYLAQQQVCRQSAYAKALASARRDARMRELEAMHAAIRRVLDRARHLIDEVAGSPAYAAALPAHVNEALSFVDGLRARVRCAGRFAAIVGPAVEAQGATLVVDETVGAGVIVETADGAVSVDNTLAARLGRRQQDLECALARQVQDGGR